MSVDQELIDSFADVLADHGEDITVHASGGDVIVSALFTLDPMSIGFNDNEPIGQTATLKLSISDSSHLNLDSSPTLTATARGKVWHIGPAETSRIGYIQCGLKMKQDELKYTNIRDINDEQIRWADE